jgi:hypothetical protein
MASTKGRKPSPLATSEARHAWLEDAAGFCTTLLALTSEAIVPDCTRLTIGWPGVGGARGNRIGECWDSRASADRHVEIFVSPRSHDSVDVLATVLHELIHAAVGNEAGHKAPFARVAKAAGLLAPMRSTPPSDELRALFEAYVASNGPYPAGALEGLASGTKKQKTHLLKAECEACGLVFRITAKWVTPGMLCPSPICGGAMHVAGQECEETEGEYE